MPRVAKDRYLLLVGTFAVADEVSKGTATLISPVHALTAAHVVFDEHGRVADELYVRALDGQEYAANVVWPPRFNRQTKPPDVALVRITDPTWQATARTTSLGRLTGNSISVDAVVMGYPRIMVDPDGGRNTLAYNGTVNPGSAQRGQTLLLNLTTSKPGRDAQQGRPHSGLSGGGLFAEDLLIGIVTHDSPDFDHGVLPCAEIAPLLDDPEFLEVWAETGNDPACYSAELNALIERPQRLAVRSVASLVRPEFETVEFYGRAPQLNELTAWCLDSKADLSIRLITGPGGRGKTRLARQLIHELGQAGYRSQNRRGRWIAGFTRDLGSGDAYVNLADTCCPVLLVIDYAETRPDEVEALIRYCSDNRAESRIRLLLIARSTGGVDGWWDQLLRNIDLDELPPLDLPPLDDSEQARRRSFASACSALVPHLAEITATRDISLWRDRARGAAPPTDIDQERYGSPLTLQLAALLTLLRQDGESMLSGQRSPLELQLLNKHEWKFWQSSAPDLNILDAAVRAQCVLLASLVRVHDREEAVSVLRSLDILSDQPRLILGKIAGWLRSMYPPPEGAYWGALQPDRLLEHLTIAVMKSSPAAIRALCTRHASAVSAHLTRTFANGEIDVEDRDELATIAIATRVMADQNRPLELEHALEAQIALLIRGAGADLTDHLLAASALEVTEIVDAQQLAHSALRMIDLETTIRNAQLTASANVQRLARSMFYEATGMSTSWILAHRNRSSDAAAFDAFGQLLSGLADRLPDLLGRRSKETYERTLSLMIEGGLSAGSAASVAATEYVYPLLDTIDLALRLQERFATIEQALEHAGAAYFAAYEDLGISHLLAHITRIPLTEHWAPSDRFSMMRSVYESLARIVAAGAESGPITAVSMVSRSGLGRRRSVNPGTAAILRRALTMDESEEIGFDRILVTIGLMRRVAATGERFQVSRVADH